MVDSRSGKPLPKTRVTLFSATGGAPPPAFTDVNGAFAFPQLAPGHYTLLAEKTGYARLRYGSHSELDPPAEIDLEGSDAPEDLVVRLTKGAAIFGRITDEFGDPVVGGQVSLVVAQAVGDAIRTVPVSRPAALTDDRGQYRLGDLPPGRYIVVLAAGNLGSTAPGTPREWERLAPWGKTFYPGAGSLGEATPIVLGPGEERGATDFSVRSHERVQVRLSTSGMVPAAPRSGPVGPNNQDLRMWFFSEDDDASINGRPIGMSGMGGDLPGIAFPNFPVNEPGDWTVFARNGEKAAITNFHLSAGDDYTIMLSFQPTSAVSGRVIFDGTAPRPALTAIAVSAKGAGADARITAPVLLGAPVSVKPDGTFVLPNLIGTIDIDATPPPGWILASATYDGRNLLDEPLALEPGENATDVQLVFSDRVGAVSGRTILSDNTPAAGCSIALFPDDSALRFNGRRMRLVRADQHGQFSIRDLPEGTYRAAAASDIDAATWLTPDAIDRLRQVSSPVTVAGRGRVPLDLPCAGAQ